jgi:hypothetical protein
MRKAARAATIRYSEAMLQAPPAKRPINNGLKMNTHDP